MPADGSTYSFTRLLIQHHTVSLKEVNYLFPLYTYPTEDQEQLGLERQPNINTNFTDAVTASFGFNFVAYGSGNLQASFGPEDVLHYIYAMLHSPEYRHRYADFLKSDFPRIPLTSNRLLFTTLIGLGKHLASIHLMESDGEEKPSFPKEGTNRIEKIQYVPSMDGPLGRVSINVDQYFEGIAQETWAFSIGGYRPAEKWLKDRKGRTLSYDDILHYSRICAVLAETPRIMARIDEEIENHGGWPIT